MANPIMTGLPIYVEERRLPLYHKAVLSAKSAKLFTLQSDIKTSAVVNLFDTTVAFGDGNTCGWDDAGSVKMSQRVLTTGQIKINMAFCEKEFLKYWTQYEVRVQAGQKTLPFEEYFINSIVENVAAEVEKTIWQGDTALTGDTNLKYFNGLIKILDAEDDVITPEVASGSTAYDAIKAVYLAIPENVLDKAVVFVGADTFRAYMQEMVEKNYYHYTADGMPAEEFVLPGTNTKVIAVNGLNGTKTIVAGNPEHIFYGCDIEGAEKAIEMWYSQDFRENRLAIEFNAGVQVAFPSEIVKATL